MNENGDDERAAARNSLIQSFLLVSTQGVHILLGTLLPDSSIVSEGQLESRRFEFDLWYWLKYFLAHKNSFCFFAEGLCKWGYPFSSRVKRAEQRNVGVQCSFSRIFVVLFSLLCPRKFRRHSVRLGKYFDFDLSTPWDSLFLYFSNTLESLKVVWDDSWLFGGRCEL